jgi:hypothetical protein
VLLEGPRDRDSSPLGGEKVAEQPVWIELESNSTEGGDRRLAQLPASESAQPGGKPAAHHQIVGNRPAIDQGEILVDESAPGHVRGGRGPERERLAPDFDGPSGIRAMEAGQDLYQGRLTGAVLPE